eukprot:UN34299
MEIIIQYINQIYGEGHNNDHISRRFLEDDASELELIIGCALAACGCLFSTSGNILVKKDALASESIPSDQHPNILRRPLVLVAIAFYILTAFFDFGALAFIPISLAACSSALTIPFNALLAYFVLGEVMHKVHWIAILIILCAAVGAVSQGIKDKADRSISEIEALWKREEWVFFA